MRSIRARGDSSAILRGFSICRGSRAFSSERKLPAGDFLVPCPQAEHVISGLARFIEFEDEIRPEILTRDDLSQFRNELARNELDVAVSIFLPLRFGENTVDPHVFMRWAESEMREEPLVLADFAATIHDVFADHDRTQIKRQHLVDVTERLIGGEEPLNFLLRKLAERQGTVWSVEPIGVELSFGCHTTERHGHKGQRKTSGGRNVQPPANLRSHFPERCSD